MEEVVNNTLQSLTDVAGKDNLWMIEVFLIVLVTLLAALIASRFVAKLTEKAKATKNLWDDALCDSLARPLKWMIWLIGLTYAANIAGQQTESSLFDAIHHIRHIGAVIVVAWFINSFIFQAESNLSSGEYLRKPMDKTTALALGKLLRISVIITAVLVVLQSLGYSVSGVLAFGGIGGIAVGFAAKDLLANFFGGLMVYLDRPFSVGDWIRSPDKNIEGTVEEIGWRLTRIRTFDKRPLYVPNSTFTQISVENPSRMLNRRIYETIGIRYDDAGKMATVVEKVKAMLLEHEAIDVDNTMIVNFNSFAASSLDFFVYCFTKTTNWVEFHEIKQDVMLKIIQIIEAEGAQCAFPTSTLHIAEPLDIRNVSDAPVEGAR